MEKVIYLAQSKPGCSLDELRDLVMSELSHQLLQHRDVLSLRFSFNDSAVTRGEAIRLEGMAPAHQAMFSMTVHSANNQQELYTLIEPYVDQIEGYLVSESEVTFPPETTGARSEGFVLTTSFRQLESISREEFLRIWREDHTQVAIDTQSTFGYRQNLVVRNLTAACKDLSAIVEEHFPLEAMDSQHAFYDAVGNEQKLQKNLNTMMESAGRFLDLGSVNSVCMSDYVIKTLP